MRWWAALALAAGCTQGSLFGPPTEATCPDGAELTYESFARPFMAAYCTRCHASTLRAEQRMGAPSLHDFDTLYGIAAFADHVDQTTAAGPAAINDSMPPSGPFPTPEERAQLGQWLACGLPP